MTDFYKKKTQNFIDESNNVSENKKELKITENENKKELEITENELKITENENKKKYTYATLMETSGQECESWYTFIRYEGNEKYLEELQKNLESIDWYILDDLSTFDLDLEHLVSAQTAKEMTKIELNSYSYHRKFDGFMKEVKLNIKDKYKNEKKMVKIFDKLGYGQIEHYLDLETEDIDEEDLTSNSDSDSDSDSDSNNDSISSSESDTKEKHTKNGIPKALLKTIRKKGIPEELLNSKLPRFAKAKRRKRKENR
jgi:hypothetical protein